MTTILYGYHQVEAKRPERKTRGPIDSIETVRERVHKELQEHHPAFRSWPIYHYRPDSDYQGYGALDILYQFSRHWSE